MKAIHIPTKKVFDITWGCYLRKEDNSLWVAVSYLNWKSTETNEFQVDEETGKIIHPDYELID